MVENLITESIEVGNIVMSKKTGKLFAAIAKAQLDIKHPPKDKTAKIPTKTGGAYSYNYADLSSVIDSAKALAKNNVAIVQNPSIDSGNGGIAVTTILGIDDGENGQWIGGTLTMDIVDNKPQTVGSGITYARRYAIQALSGIAAEQDDDGGISTRGYPGDNQKQQQESKPKEVGIDITKYVINVGKNWVGKKLHEVPGDELYNASIALQKLPRQLSKDEADFIYAVERYLQ